MTWSTGLCDCCAEPGGGKLCCITCCCPCLTTGNINHRLEGPLGFWGGCLAFVPGAALLSPCLVLGCLCCNWGPSAASKAGFEEGLCTACLKTHCCMGCYLCQVHRELEIKKVGQAFM